MEKVIVSFEVQGGYVDFSAKISQDQAAQDAQASLDRHGGDVALAAENFLAGNPSYTYDETTFFKPGNYVRVSRSGRVEKF